MNSLPVSAGAVSQMDFLGGAPADGESSADLHRALAAHRRSLRSTDKLGDDSETEQLRLGLPKLPLKPLNSHEWLPADVLGMLEGMLFSELRQLDDTRASEETRAEVIKWIAAPLKKRAEVHRDPFSFQGCCYAAGVDPEEMQELLLTRFAPERLA